MRKIIKNILNFLKGRKPRIGVSLVAMKGQIVIVHSKGQLPLTPALARKIAAELPAMAEIAERGLGGLEAVA
jgi:hypothetical protein